MALQPGTSHVWAGAGGTAWPSSTASARCTLSLPPDASLPLRAGAGSTPVSRAPLQGTACRKEWALHQAQARAKQLHKTEAASKVHRQPCAACVTQRCSTARPP